VTRSSRLRVILHATAALWSAWCATLSYLNGPHWAAACFFVASLVPIDGIVQAACTDRPLLVVPPRPLGLLARFHARRLLGISDVRQGHLQLDIERQRALRAAGEGGR
jgi:hypothetical protein